MYILPGNCVLFGRDLQGPLPRWKEIAIMTELQIHGKRHGTDVCEGGIWFFLNHVMKAATHPVCGEDHFCPKPKVSRLLWGVPNSFFLFYHQFLRGQIKLEKDWIPFGWEDYAWIISVWASDLFRMRWSFIPWLSSNSWVGSRSPLNTHNYNSCHL